MSLQHCWDTRRHWRRQKFNAEYEITFHRNPMDVPEETEICQTLIKASEEALGFKPIFIGGSAWLDTQIIWKKGYPQSSMDHQATGHMLQLNG
ncbi:hypothetical protein JW865_06890 [Candidatus Bathyarchaeota archaeon]|nr:hypothetical protein [Candidatus Bathyarchaeota archaeon]